MTNEVEIEALRPFNRTAQGEMVHPGDKPFMVGEVRAGELEALGLAKRTGKAVKVAPTPANKMAAEPTNKGVKAAAEVEQRAIRSVSLERSGPKAVKLSGRD